MKTIRWMFYFQEGSVKSEAVSEDEDARIRLFVKKNPKGTLHLPNSDMDIWVNFDLVKAITRQMVDLEAEKIAHAEQMAAQQPKDAA